LNLLKKLKIVLCLFWLFLAEADNNLPHNIQNARLSIGQIKNRYYLGTGFFVNQNHFLTNFHAIEGMLNKQSFQDIYITQDHTPHLMIIKSGQIDEHTFDVLLQSAESHYPPAQYVVSLSYFVRPEIKNHLDKALYWLRLSAEQEYVPAQYLLGNMLAHKDFEQALYWWNKAASYGHTGSLNKLNMPKDQAQELSLTKPLTGIYN